MIHTVQICHKEIWRCHKNY